MRNAKRKITSAKSKSYILEPSYRKIVEFILREINNQCYFKVKSITKWYILKELRLPKYKICGALSYGISIKVARIVKELVNLKIVEKDGKSRYRNLNKGNIRKAEIFEILKLN